MTKLDAFKFAANAAVGAGTITITSSIIRNNVACDTLPLQISVRLAAFVIGSMAASATRSHTSARIDEIVEQWNQAQSDEDAPVTA
jgi:hypothetical protein